MHLRLSGHLLAFCLALTFVAVGCAEAKSGGESDSASTSGEDGTLGDGGGDVTLGDATVPDGGEDAVGDLGDLADLADEVDPPLPTPRGSAVSPTGGGGHATSSSHRLRMAVGTPPFAVSRSADHTLVLGPANR